MRRQILALALCLTSCASLPTLTERPEHCQLYRAARVAPTLEERLSAADRYLREVPGGLRDRWGRAKRGREFPLDALGREVTAETDFYDAVIKRFNGVTESVASLWLRGPRQWIVYSWRPV